jgi:hypothetical protein
VENAREDSFEPGDEAFASQRAARAGVQPHRIDRRSVFRRPQKSLPILRPVEPYENSERARMLKVKK